MSTQYIFTMYKLSRVHPPDKRVLEDISLSFLPGAKIGVLGANGAGKSTLLRIMAGQDTDFRGDAQLAPGATVGLLEQEPQLDPSKDVRGNVEDGVRELRDMLDRFNELAANYSDETAGEFARLQDRIDAADAWQLDTTLEIAMDALRLPPGDADVETLSGGERRRVALCRLLLHAPDLLLLDEPTNHLDAESVAWLERHLEDYKGTVVAVTHDRYFLDNVAGWILELDRGRGIPFKGNYSAWLEQKQARLAQEERQESARQRTIARELEWVRESPKGRRTKARAQAQPLRGAARRGARREARPRADPHPGGAEARRRGRGGRRRPQGLRRPPADGGPVLHAAAGGDRGRDRPERRRQDHPVPDDRRRRAGRRRRACASASRSSWPTSTSRATRSTPRRPSGRRSRTATTRSRWASAR